MTHLSRMQKALRRQGVALSYDQGVYYLSRDHARAQVLLPPALPLEEKAVLQLLNFAAVQSADGTRQDAKNPKGMGRMTEDEIGKQIVDLAVQIHREVGPGQLETVYEIILAHELRRRGIWRVTHEAWDYPLR